MPHKYYREIIKVIKYVVVYGPRQSGKTTLVKKIVENSGLKANIYQKNNTKMYYWRTYTGAELDLIKERDGVLTGFEIKWKDKKVVPPKSWIETYGAEFEVVTKNNWLSFIV